MFARQILKGLQTIVNKNETRITLIHARVIDDGIGTTLFEGLHSILVTIKRGTFQRQKDAALRTVTRVCCYLWVLLIQLV